MEYESIISKASVDSLLEVKGEQDCRIGFLEREIEEEKRSVQNLEEDIEFWKAKIKLLEEQVVNLDNLNCKICKSFTIRNPQQLSQPNPTVL